MKYFTAEKGRINDKVIDAVQQDFDYIDADGNIVIHAKRNYVMVRDENDLDLLTNYSIGSVAFTADSSNTWVKDADGTWQSVSGGGGSTTAVVGTAIVGTSTAG